MSPLPQTTYLTTTIKSTDGLKLETLSYITRRRLFACNRPGPEVISNCQINNLISQKSPFFPSKGKKKKRKTQYAVPLRTGGQKSVREDVEKAAESRCREGGPEPADYQESAEIRSQQDMRRLQKE